MPSPEVDEDEDGDGDEDTHKKAEDTNASGIPLVVNISKGSGQFLEFGATVFHDEITIDSLSIKNPKDSDDQLAYEGPDFQDLDENLQNAFYKYLEVRGIKPSMTNFLFSYMANKDMKEYRLWLTNLKKFVEKLSVIQVWGSMDSEKKHGPLCFDLNSEANAISGPGGQGKLRQVSLIKLSKLPSMAGYKHADCARVYKNEKEIEAAVKDLFSSGVVNGNQILITSKLWYLIEIASSHRSTDEELGRFAT